MEGLMTIFGGLLGGGFRLVPEIMKFLDAKNARAHELAMFDKQLEADKGRDERELAKIQAQGQMTLDAAGLDALKEAIKGQSQMTGVKWVDGLNQLMRPIITLQWVVLLYPAVIVATYILMLQHGDGAMNALLKVFGPEEKAMVAGIVNFWFLDRVLRKNK